MEFPSLPGLRHRLVPTGADAETVAWLRRMLGFTALVGGAVALVAVRRFLQGAPLAALIEWASVFGMGLVCAWVLRNPTRTRRHVATHLLTALGMAGIVGTAVLLGQSQSPSLYYVMLIPLAAGYYGGARAATAWGLASVVTVVGLRVSENFVTIPSEIELTSGDMLSIFIVVLVIVTGFVVTAERTLEQRARDLEKARDAALRASELKSSFLATMSHEIRTPLAGVLGMAELLSTTRLDDEQRQLAETLAASGRSLLAIINDVLSLAKIEAGKLEIERAPFTLRALFDDVGRLFAESARRKGLVLIHAVEPPLPCRVEGDRTRLLQVLSNLISNAIKFTEHGGVRLRATLAEGSTADAPRLRVEVEDDGIGVPPDIQPRLFKAFEQAEASTARRFGGTGLGLAISARLMGLMGGQIGLVSREGHGACFWFELPLAVAEDDTAHRQRELAAWAPLGGRRALVVDANPTRRALHAAMCREGGLVAESLDDPNDLAKRLSDRDAPPVHAVLLAGDLPDALPAEHPPLLLLGAPVLDADTATRAQALPLPLSPAPLRSALLRALNLAATSPEAQQDVAGALASRPLAGRSVLVVDDNNVNRLIARRFLQRLGALVREAADGEAALAALAAERVDLVLMDCQMPVMDGFAATRALRDREAEGGAHLPVVAMTASAFEEDVQRCLVAGMDVHLAKPFTLEQLAAAVLPLLGLPRRPLAGQADGADLPQRPRVNA